MKIKLSGAKNQKFIGTGKVRRTLDESTLCGYRNRKHDQQRLKDIELQRWLISEINNDTRKHANQGNKMRTYRLLKTIDN